MVDFKDYFEYYKDACKEVFANRINVLYIAGISFLFVIFNLIIREFLQIGELLFSSPTNFLDAIWYSWMSMPTTSKFLMLAISILSSMLLVFVYIAFRKNQKLSGKAGSGGIVLGLLAPACPSCGIGVLSLLGFGSIGAFLPFGGKEIGIVAIFVLIGSLLYVSREIAAPRCKI